MNAPDMRPFTGVSRLHSFSFGLAAVTGTLLLAFATHATAQPASGKKAGAEGERQRMTKDEGDDTAPRTPTRSQDVNEPEVTMDGLWQPAGKGGNLGVKASDALKTGAAAEKLDAKVNQIIEFYLSMYDRHLSQNNWILRSFAVISLARIQDPRVNDRLMQVMATGRYVPKSKTAAPAPGPAKPYVPSPPDMSTGAGLSGERRSDILVKVFAWEALAARYDFLTPEQQKSWRAYGLSMARKNWLAGDLRCHIVKMMECEGPTQENLNLFSHLFANTNSLDPYDIHTLEAMRNCVGVWKHAGLVKALISAMGNLDDFYRAEFLLGDLGAGVPLAMTLKDKGSKYMMRATQEAWFKWFTDAKLEPVKPGDERPRFTPSMSLMPPGEHVRDHRDPRWRKDLELEQFRLDPIDVGFVVDSTGSMGHVVRWVQSDVMKMMRAFELISTEPRIGITFYRDHGDEYVTQLFPLTSSAGKLAKAIQGCGAKGGADLPEAIFDALKKTVNEMGWSKSSNIHKVVVLIGDAPPHENTLPQIQELVEQSAKAGAKFYAVKVYTPKGASELPSYDDIAKWGGGKSMEAVFSGTPGAGSCEVARAMGKDSPDQIIFGEVLKGCLAQGYQDRVDNFVAVLSQYVQMPLKEQREHFDPAKPAPPRGEHNQPGHGQPQRPKDPREQ